MSDRVAAVVERRLEKQRTLDAHGCWRSLICNRCGVALTLISTSEVELEPHLHTTAAKLGWSISSASRQGMGCGEQPTPLGMDEDLCPPCFGAIQLRTPGRAR